MNGARTSIVPATRLLVLVAIAIVPAALLSAIPGWAMPGYALIALCAVIAIADAWLAPRRLVGIEIRAPDVVRLWKDREGSFDLIVRNETRIGRALRLGIQLPEEITSPDEEQVVGLPRDVEFSRVGCRCQPSRRGRYSIEGYRIGAASPLGLWDARRSLAAALEIRVYPNLAAERKKSPEFFKRGRMGAFAQRQIGKGREFEKLREYVPGDGFDEVDWKATARRGHPITRVFQIEKTQEVYIILDASRLTARPSPAEVGATILERNVNAALLLALAAEKQGDLFGLATFSDTVHGFVRARNGKAHNGACQDALYTLQPRLVTPDFNELFTLLRLRLRRRALLVFLTELDDPVLAESFVRNVNLIRKQHLVVVGMAKPAGARPLFEDSNVENTDAVYAKLAGHLQWAKLRELGKILERQGVRFALLDPEGLGPRLASLYLDVKRRQLL
jgi:uncharacterized protein (DUF58 family)